MYQTLKVNSSEVFKVQVYGSQLEMQENCDATPTMLALQKTISTKSQNTVLYSKTCPMSHFSILMESDTNLYEFLCMCSFNSCDRLGLLVGKPKVQITICEIDFIKT